MLWKKSACDRYRAHNLETCPHKSREYSPRDGPARSALLFGEAIGGDKAAVFRFEPAAPVRRRGVANIGDRKVAGAWRWRHVPAHHRQFALGARITDHGCWVIR